MSRRGFVAVVLAALLALWGVAGCATTDQGPTPAQRRSQAAERAAEQRQQAAEQRRQKQTAIYQECKQVAGQLDKRLTDLDSRLSVGMQFSEYGDAVGSAKVSYDRMLRSAKARGGVSGPCINRVAVRFESALRAYVKAYNTWNGCIQDTYCSIDGSTKAKMQASWAKASRLIQRGDSALSALQPGT